MIGELQSNWAKLEPERQENDEQGDLWKDWGDPGMPLASCISLSIGLTTYIADWTRPGSEGSKYEQRLKQSSEEQPMPDGVTTRVSVIH